MRRLILGLCAAVLLAGPAVAETYPARPIRLVVGYSPGGGNDLIARIVAAKLQEKLGQPVIVDNRPGAQSIVAAEAVAKAPSDGYTLLVAPSGPMTINPAVYAKLSYSPERDFSPVSLLAEFPLLLAVGAEQPPKTVGELVEYGRAHPNLANCLQRHAVPARRRAVQPAHRPVPAHPAAARRVQGNADDLRFSAIAGPMDAAAGARSNLAPKEPVPDALPDYPHGERWRHRTMTEEIFRTDKRESRRLLKHCIRRHDRGGVSRLIRASDLIVRRQNKL
jgi:hypothetical protein